MSTPPPQSSCNEPFPDAPRVFGITVPRLRRKPTDVSIAFTPGLRLSLTSVRSAAHGVMVDRLCYFTEPDTQPNHILVEGVGPTPLEVLQTFGPCGPCGKIVITVWRSPCPALPPRLYLRRRGRLWHARMVTERHPERWQPRRRPFGMVLLGQCVWREPPQPKGEPSP